MNKQEFIERATEALRPFETDNLIHTMQTLTLKQIFTNPVFLIIVTLLLFLGIVKRSKTVLLTLFSMIGLIVIMRFAMPAASTSEELSLNSVVPFIVIGVIIGGVVIYFSLVKSD